MVSFLLGIWLMTQLSTASIHASVSSGWQKAWIHGGAPELHWRSCCWNVWRGSSEDKTSAPFISGGPSSKFTRPSCSSRAAFRSATRWLQTHFKVSPAAVTSALRNVTRCLVPCHWLIPCVTTNTLLRGTKKMPPLRVSPSLLDQWLMLLMYSSQQFSYSSVLGSGI